jgi:hypothetical protein
MNKRTIFGLPITPIRLLDEIEGNSFCVSYATRKSLGKQLDQVIEKVNAAEDGILLIDNGAFSAWKNGEQLDLEAFADWAGEICDRCPKAVVVVPDKIDGTEKENHELYLQWAGVSAFSEWDMIGRQMIVWHLDESLERLGYWLDSGCDFIAFGSAGEYAQTGTAKWHDRIREVFAFMDEHLKNSDERTSRPWIHMMRAQGEAHKYDFDSADSCTVAVNHHRYKHEGSGHAGRYAARVKARIDATHDGDERFGYMKPDEVTAWRRSLKQKIYGRLF